MWADAEPLGQRLPYLVAQPDPGSVYRLLREPMDAALRPDHHGVIHEVGDVRVPSLIHHVMVLVDVEYVRRTRQRASPSPVSPACEHPVVLLHDESDRCPAPSQQPLKPPNRVGHKAEVVEINVEDRTHVSKTPEHRPIRQRNTQTVRHGCPYAANRDHRGYEPLPVQADLTSADVGGFRPLVALDDFECHRVTFRE